jgi:hypothetical protein
MSILSSRGGFPNRIASQGEKFISKRNSWQYLPDDRAGHLEHVHHILVLCEGLFFEPAVYTSWGGRRKIIILRCLMMSLAQIIGLLCEQDWHSIQDLTPAGAQEEVASEEMMQDYSRQLLHRWQESLNRAAGKRSSS